MKETKLRRKIISLFLCAAMIISYIPILSAANVAISKAAITGTVTDPGTAYTWESMMGTETDGNRYSGRMWVDKSVYKDGDTAVLNTKGDAGSSFTVDLADDEAFQIIFSALGSTMTSKSTVSSSGPMDVVLVLDDSTSMDDIVSGNTTRLEKLIEASNKLLSDLLTMKNIRIGIVAYNSNSIEILPFDFYENGVELKVRNNKYTFDERNSSDKGGTIQAFDNDGTLLYNNTSGYARGTNVQAGINTGLGMLENASDTEGRTPVAIILTDGAANTAATKTFYNIDSQTPVSFLNGSNPASVILATMLNASYKKVMVEDKYGVAPMIYGIGVDIAGNAAANAVINPGAETNGFNSENSENSVRTAYSLYNQWINASSRPGGSVSRTENYNGNHVFTFDHNYTGVTLDRLTENINYVDTYYPVSSAELNDTFNQIYEELSSGVFNPITSSTSYEGGTGVDDTPLIYVDFIGQYMEVKEIQSVTLFGSSYGVIKNADGTYKVAEATGINPTTNESWNTAEDITISIIPQADGTQKLEIRINQEILPIILERVVSETVGEINNSTITEFIQDPIRVYYTVGIDSDILLPNGEVDITKIQGYDYIDDVNGTVSFYSNRFGVSNPADGTELVTKGDAHAGFRPSAENRFYYHQTNQGIFTKITDKNGKNVEIEENNEYGIVWEEGLYDLSWMTYDEYKNMDDADKIYTYVSYYRPTEITSDAENAAENVTYLVYTNWLYLKESVAFYDANTETYLNDGKVADESTVNEYLRANPDAELYAVLGIGSRRTSRLHNMTVYKTENATGTATERYTPEYLDIKSDHNDNDVIVWLGNNGRITVEIDTGIALTKAVTDIIGNEDDTYPLTVTVPAGVAADPVAVDSNGDEVEYTYENNVLTVYVKAGQTVYISGIPGGTECEIGETVDGDYYIESKTDKVTIPLVSEVLNGAEQFVSATVTNSPNKYGNLYITKEITSDHTVPENIAKTSFSIDVNVGRALAGRVFSVIDSAHSDPYTVTVDSSGIISFAISAAQTIEILDIPAGTEVTVREALTAEQSNIFAVQYRARNHSGEQASETTDAATVTIPNRGNATAVVINTYNPMSASLDLDLLINKNFADASVADRLEGGVFSFKAQKYNTSDKKWEDLASATISYSANEYGEKSAIIENVLKNEIYTAVGTYSYRIFEEKGSVANVTYDRIIYTFDVIVTDTDGQLTAKAVGIDNSEIKNVTGDGALDYVTTYTNTFETAPVSMDITKTVINRSGDTAVSAGGFKFRSVEVDEFGNELYPNAGETTVNTIFSDAAGEARISGVYTKEQIGTHYYIVYEENEGKAGWTYSDAQYMVTVTVAEDAEGKLSAVMTIVPYNDAAREEAAPTVTDNNKGQLHFTNTYDPEDVTVDLDGAVEKVLTGMALEADQFTFYVYRDGDRTAPILTGTNDLDGDVRFVDFDKVLTFEGVGKYQYDIVEYIPSGAVYDPVTDKYVLNGMSYDGTIHDLVVEVTNDTETGKLTASYYFEDSIGNVVTYYNSYKATPAEYEINGVKIVHGRAPREGEFEFELYFGDTLAGTATNKADGSFAFKAVTFTEAGTYTYTVKEKDGNIAGIRYDGVDTPVTFTVTVTDNNGKLEAKADIEDGEIRFENTYEANPAEVIFNGTKTLRGGELADNSFTFKLYRTDNSFDTTLNTAELLGEAKNIDGAFSFAQLFETTGTYYFVILEDVSDSSPDGIVYDRTQHKFAVYVNDVGDGQLKATVVNMTANRASTAAAAVTTEVSFTNATFDEVTEKEVYLADNTSTEIDGKKVNAGDILTYFITYTNYTGENVVVDIMDTIPDHTSYVEGSASHNGTYAGTHLNWVLNVARGEKVTVSFEVKVDETEAIVANTAYVRDGKNTYTTNEVVNHTVDNEIIKDVFYSGDPTTSIDGKKVYAGEELLYKISFINASGEAIDLTITDVIPENTTYVADSAESGVYADGKLTWNISNVPAWATVTVAFKVKVNENIGAADIENRASATDGENSYETNIVTNYTVEDEVAKDVFAADEPTVSIDGKKVYAGDELLYTITYKNTAKEDAAVTITDNIPQYTTYVENSADNGGTYTNGVVTWNATVAAGESITVSFKVTVDADIADGTILNSAYVAEGTNTYETNEVINYTVEDKDDDEDDVKDDDEDEIEDKDEDKVEDEVVKDVFAADEPTVSIDGKAVEKDDVLIYAITYRNTANEKVTVTITDTVPDHTAYVDGTADNGGVYSDGVITWTLDVDAGETVTVSFKIKVTSAEGNDITNRATVLEGENTYTTNEVINPIAKTEDQIPPAPKPQVPTAPQTGDETMIGVWLTIMIVSGAAALGLTLDERKKKAKIG